MRAHGPRQFVVGLIAVLAVTIGLVIPPASALVNDLFVSSAGTDSVLEYDATGAFVASFVAIRNSWRKPASSAWNCQLAPQSRSARS